MNKKAQVEIIGLVLIVLIITIAMLFYLSYSVDDKINPEKSAYNKYTNTELSVSFIQSLLDTSECGTNVQELIVNCARFKNIRCGTKTSCEQLNETITNVLNLTLDKWGTSYWLVVDFDEYSNLTYFTPDCKPNAKIAGTNSPGIQPISLFPGEAYVKLAICS